MPSIERDTPSSVLYVVAGLLRDGDRVFLTRRPITSHQGGRWEFPGGKLATGEEARAGLARELEEELGIVVRAAEPFAQVQYAYPERTVLLDVWRIVDFSGVPHGREGQTAAWRDIATLLPSEFPPADRPIVRRLQLPRLYLISDIAGLGADRFRDALERALMAGARLIQLREPGLDAEPYRRHARDLASLCHRYGAKLLLNADPEWVSECGADGVHLSARRLAALEARPLAPDLWVGASCHDREELRRAQALECDFALLSPVKPTASHPGAEPMGWTAFATLAAGSVLPVYALGGLTSEDARAARNAHAIGIAMMRGVWRATDVSGAVARALAG